MHNEWHQRANHATEQCARWQKTAAIAVIAGFGIAWSASASAADGKALFESDCSSCHSIGAGVLAGPDLAGINARRGEDWLVKFIKSEQALIKEGDRIASALAHHYNIGMPDQALSDEEARAILSYIAASEKDAAAAKQGSLKQTDEIRKGRDLFEGRARLSAGGPSCYACHTAASAHGGILAGELTSISSRMGKEWVGGVLKEAPFPAMLSAYHGKPLAESEIAALVSYLESTAAEPLDAAASNWSVLGGALAGVGLLTALFAFTGRNRRKHSVYQDIYDRQTKAG